MANLRVQLWMNRSWLLSRENLCVEYYASDGELQADSEAGIERLWYDGLGGPIMAHLPNHVANYPEY